VEKGESKINNRTALTSYLKKVSKYSFTLFFMHCCLVLFKKLRAKNSDLLPVLEEARVP
jgi:hypothetical protein